jgi:hypothetical protein
MHRSVTVITNGLVQQFTAGGTGTGTAAHQQTTTHPAPGVTVIHNGPQQQGGEYHPTVTVTTSTNSQQQQAPIIIDRTNHAADQYATPVQAYIPAAQIAPTVTALPVASASAMTQPAVEAAAPPPVPSKPVYDRAVLDQMNAQPEAVKVEDIAQAQAPASAAAASHSSVQPAPATAAPIAASSAAAASSHASADTQPRPLQSLGQLLASSSQSSASSHSTAEARPQMPRLGSSNNEFGVPRPGQLDGHGEVVEKTLANAPRDSN